MKARLLYVFGLLGFIFCEARELQRFRVDFHQSMNADFANHDFRFCRTDATWRLAESLYKKHFQLGMKFAEKPHIPYIIHHIWLGSNLPDYARDFRQTWVNKHPGWTFILWTDHPEIAYGDICLHSFQDLADYLKEPNRENFIIMDMRSVRLQNQFAYDIRAVNYGEKSDIIRYQALHEIGGLYVDTDFECLRSFKDFHHCLHFYTGISHSREFSLYNGLIASAPGMSILEEINVLLSDRPRLKSSVPENDSLKYTGPHFFTECFVKKALTFEGQAVAFPVTFFYAWPAYQRFDTFEQAQKYLVQESYALHYWKVSWNK